MSIDAGIERTEGWVERAIAFWEHTEAEMETVRKSVEISVFSDILICLQRVRYYYQQRNKTLPQETILSDC